MKRIIRSLMVFLLSIAMMMPNADSLIAYALSEPFDRSELTVPEELQDGGSWYFIHENIYTVSEKSNDKLYIPIQRTGDLSREGDVSLKLVDVTARHDVTYKEEMFRENPETDLDLADVSIMELVDSAESQEEFDPVSDEEFGEALSEQGGADVVDAEGKPVGTITAQKVDENGNPVIEEEEETPAEEEVISEETEETVPEEQPAEEAQSNEVELENDPSSETAEWEKGEPTSVEDLRKAREEFTGTVSDRQALEGGDGFSALNFTQPEEPAELVEDSMPGKVYNLHFEAGEDAKYLVITPLYDEAADGDAQLMLMLKNPDDESQVAENYRVTTVSFKDEDEAQPVVISMAEEMVIAENGKAYITVTREGMKNSLIGIHMTSWGGSAVMGEDYSGVGADLYFPMGITSRTVELAVVEGDEQKDFYVTLTAQEGSNTEIGQQTVHVLIPAAGKEADIKPALNADTSDVIRLGEAVNIEKASGTSWGQNFEFINGGNGFKSTTRIDKEGDTAGYEWSMPRGWYYDGLFLEYGMYLNYCDAMTVVSSYGDSRQEQQDQEDTGGWRGGRTMYFYYKDQKSPEKIDVLVENIDNEGFSWNDSYARVELYSVTPILRRFRVTVTDPVMLDGTKPSFAGMDAAGVKEQTAVILNDGTDNSCTIWGGDTFSISQVAGQKYVRLAAIDAVKKDGTAYRIAVGDGTSQTLVGELDEATVNGLGEAGFFEWTKGPGGPDGNANSKQGNLTVRPVFEYYNAKVEIKGSQYGNLVTSVETSPSLLFDFNSSKSMNNVMNGASIANMTIEPKDEYYTFTATKKDPQVRIMLGADDVSEIQWVKVRARTSSEVEAIELFGHSGEGSLDIATCTHVDVTNDGEWHTYIINIPEENVRTANEVHKSGLTETAWQGKIDWIRLDPMWNHGNTVIKNQDNIDIDYIAFFPTKEEAEIFREADTKGTKLLEGVYNFHIGDVLDLTTELSEAGEKAGLKGDGFRYNLFTQQNGEDISRGTSAYANDKGVLKLRGTSDDDSRTGMYYRLEPTFTETVNQVVVQIEEEDLKYFDSAEGVLNTADKWQDGTVWNYRVAKDIRSNEVFELWAETADPQNIPVWIGADNTACSGEAYYMMSGVFASDNIVKLSVNTSASSHAYYSLSGNVYAQVMNLATGRPSDEMVPAKEALVSSGYTSAVTEEEGDFSLPAKYLVGNTTVRYTVTYNGYVSIRETKVAPAGAKKQDAVYYDPSTGKQTTVEAIPVSLNTVAVDSWSANSAHFGRVDVEQNGVLNGVINTVQMNGKKVVFTVHVEPGQPYTYNNQQYEEKVTDVMMYFQNQKTKEIHGTWSIKEESDPVTGAKLEWDASSQTAKLTIDSVSPESNSYYRPGDVLMLQLSTDRKISLAAFAGHDMQYDPVSTGITMVADLNFEPQNFNWDVSDIASMLQVMGPGESGSGTGEGYNFGRFPFLNEINAGLKIATALSNFGVSKAKQHAAREIITDLMGEPLIDYDLDDWQDHINDDSYMIDGENGRDVAEDEAIQPGDGAGISNNISVTVAFTSKPTYYGGVRFALAVIAAYNGGSSYTNTGNPFKNAEAANSFFTSGRYKRQRTEFTERETVLLFNPHFGSKGEEIRSMFGGSRFTIGIYTGLYLDFGYVVKNGEKSGDVVCMGGGGFAGGIGSVGYTLYSTIYGIPVYVAPEANIDVTFYIGVGGNPEKTLEAFREDRDIEASDYQFSFEFNGHLDAGMSLGVGIYKVLGGRITGKIGFDAGYGNHMAEWYPTDNSNWGYTTDFTAEGTIDLVITDLNLVSLSFPLPWEDGWMATFSEVFRAKKVIAFVSVSLKEGKGSAEARSQAQAMVDELKALVLDQKNLDRNVIKAKADALRSYAYGQKIIAEAAYVDSYCTRVGGILGGIAEEFLYAEGLIGYIPGVNPGSITVPDSSTGISVVTRDHVGAEWLDAKKALNGSYKPVTSQVLQADAFTQTSSQILPVGSGKYLMVFLSDNQNRDRQMAAQLVYTVYDANTGTWTQPAAVQNDMTADGKPHLADAGDKVVLTWASIPDEKYTQLKAEIADELAPLNGGQPADEAVVTEALEADPSRVMDLMEIYAVEFDKASLSFTEIEQLTDDYYYDDNPQTAYDSETGDYIVLYYKTGQNDEEYTDSSSKLLDMAGVSADPSKTYSMLCYMLHNNQTDTKDTLGRTHEPGWARDYLFPNETSQDEVGQQEFLLRWKGQRFLPTAAGDMSDPAIGDLTVSEGYNGLASFAFTVDKDYNLTTGEDKDLYVQFYDFSEHSTYIAVKVAGERTENGLTSAVEVGMPKLVRNDGSTWLFWREDGTDLRYLNVSEMLSAKVATTANPGEDDWTYAVRSDGTFATDAVTGEQYRPESGEVEFGTHMTDGSFNGTEYQVITDAEDNLYVVWSDTVRLVDQDPVSGEDYMRTAQELFATAMIRQDDGSTSWSKPNRLTTGNKFNDGIAIALDVDGSLMIVHNQYEKLYADTTEEVAALFENGQLTLKEDADGQKWVVGSLMYNSPNSLVLTRCESVGSVEATKFVFSHDYPVAGENVQVSTVIENTGMTKAEGFNIAFYEYKDGVRGRKIADFSSDEEIPVNGLRTLDLIWKIPEEGVEGYSIQAECVEKKGDGTAYSPVLSYSSTFKNQAAIRVNVDSVVQNGDVFDITYTVTNYGNLEAAEGTEASLSLCGLYGDLEERYGVADGLLATEDLSGLGARETRVITETVEVPLSVFEYCGYDAVEAEVTADDQSIAISEELMFALESPMHLSVNDGNDIDLEAGESVTVTSDYDANLFIDSEEVVYSIEDPNIASIDENGTVTGLGNGTTTLTATFLPSGRTASVQVTVTGAVDEQTLELNRSEAEIPTRTTLLLKANLPVTSWTSSDETIATVDENGLVTALRYGKVTITATSEDGQTATCEVQTRYYDVNDESKYYWTPVYWAADNAITKGYDNVYFGPQNNCTREAVVTFLWRLAGKPEPQTTVNPFSDVSSSKYYYKAVLWAAENGITKGYKDGTFRPDDTCLREHVVTFLYRYAGKPDVNVTVNPFNDVKRNDYYYRASVWANQEGIAKGYSEGEHAGGFGPKLDCLREHVVTFLYRYAK